MRKKGVTKELVGLVLDAMIPEDNPQKKTMKFILGVLNIDKFKSVSDVKKVLNDKEALDELVEDVKSKSDLGDTSPVVFDAEV